MKLLNRVTKVLAVVLSITMMLSLTAFADSGNEPHFDFWQREIHLAKGDVLHMPVYVSDEEHNPREEFPTFSVYIVGKESKNTYVWSDFQCGYTYVDIFIGDDETAKDFTLYFYIDGQDEWDSVTVHIVDPINSDVEATRTAAIYEMMGIDPKTKQKK